MTRGQSPRRDDASLESRTRAIAKLDSHPLVPFWPAGLYPHHVGTSPRRPMFTTGHALQRAAAENG